MRDSTLRWFNRQSPSDQDAIVKGRAAVTVALARRPGETQAAHLGRIGALYSGAFGGDPFRLVKAQNIGLSYRPAEQIEGTAHLFGHGASGRGMTLLGGGKPVIVLSTGLPTGEEEDVLLHELGHVAMGGGDDALADAFVQGWRGHVTHVSGGDSVLHDGTLPPGVRWRRAHEDRVEAQRRRASARAEAR